MQQLENEMSFLLGLQTLQHFPIDQQILDEQRTHRNVDIGKDKASWNTNKYICKPWCSCRPHSRAWNVFCWRQRWHLRSLLVAQENRNDWHGIDWAPSLQAGPGHLTDLFWCNNLNTIVITAVKKRESQGNALSRELRQVALGSASLLSCISCLMRCEGENMSHKLLLVALFCGSDHEWLLWVTAFVTM